ncbi:protein of unknown function [Algoriphagus locisalis]|uniref:DUF4270 domain-containing protein n=1 Tax=Algoriphagus locisalis TaxID=305507 RepID=A0A1I7AV22_9BACT|nr:protein of unknown function [Algoriphagus locisalis]
MELAPGNNQIGVVFEEFELPASVVLLDSFNTTNQAVLVVGEEEDDFFGKTSGTGYSRLSYNANSNFPKEDAVLDSVLFRLNVRVISGTDLDQGKAYSVHKLTENILDTAYYNYDELLYEETPFASTEVVFGEETDTLVSFPVNQEFAEELFADLKDSVFFQDPFVFRDYFPGIALKGRAGDNASIGVGLGTSTGITAYYHYEGDTVSSTYSLLTSVSLSGGGSAAARNFSGIKSDRSGTPTQVVTESNQAYDVGSLVGIKSGMRMAIKLDTSPLDEFLDTLSGVTFNQVLLEIGELEPQDETERLPANIRMFFTDSNNEVLTSSDGTELTVQADGFPQVQLDEDGDEIPSTSNPATLFYDSEERVYSELITSHVNAIFRGKLTRRDWLIYGIDSKQSLSQLVVNTNRIKVKVIYSRSR